jgi:ribokinase
MNEKKRIIVIGSSNTDMVIKSERLPKPGETILGGKFLMNLGGKGANQAIAVAKLGGNVSFICKVGNDTFGKKAIASFCKEHIDTRYISISSDKPSGIALINVDSKGENCISVASGANSSLSIENIKEAENDIKEASIVLMQLEIPMGTVIYAANMAKKNGAIVILNPAPVPAKQLPIELLSNVDILTPNITETEMISGLQISDEESIKEAIKTISNKGVKNIIVTMGSKGALAYQNGVFFHVPAIKVDAIDTTAAGDTFCGGLSVAIAEGMTLLESIQFANKASSICVTRMGAQESIPLRQEIK